MKLNSKCAKVVALLGVHFDYGFIRVGGGVADTTLTILVDEDLHKGYLFSTFVRVAGHSEYATAAILGTSGRVGVPTI